MVVVGNGNGVLGWGQGKAAEVNDSVQKAFQRACRNLYPISRYNDHTITEPMNAKYGQVSCDSWRHNLDMADGCWGIVL
jgi:small subunit ribosomal protein S5